MPDAKPQLYRDLAVQLGALLDGESDPVANAANMVALIWHGLPELNWAGFYFRRGSELVLGPFQGKPACLRILVGQGVCGTAAARGSAVLVPDVHEFPGHIACDPDSRSELVVPLVEDGAVLGVLDLDSPVPDRFDDADRAGSEELVALFVAHHRRLAPTDADDIDPASGCRLPLPRREDLDEESLRIYDRLADPGGGTLRGLRGPGGIQLHSPELSRRSRPVNHYLRYESGLGGRVRELAILATAREHDSRFEWAAHEPAARARGHLPRNHRHHPLARRYGRARRTRRHRPRPRPRNLRRQTGLLANLRPRPGAIRRASARRPRRPDGELRRHRGPIDRFRHATLPRDLTAAAPVLPR